ncbi:MAG: hypothetical protein ACRC46_14165 [Thermoguttaceae bacterium]
MSAISACGCYSSCASSCSTASSSSKCSSSESGAACSSSAAKDALRDWLDLSGETDDASRVSAAASAAQMAAVEKLIESTGELTEDASVTENTSAAPETAVPETPENSEDNAAPISAMSEMFAPFSIGTPGTVEDVTDKRNSVASKLRELLGGNAFHPAGAKFTVTYNYQDNTVTVGGNISTSAKTTLQNAINSDTAGVAALMRDLRDSLGIDTPAGLTKRNFTLAMTSLADLEPSSDLSYNINVKISPNSASVPAGQTPPTISYSANVGGTLPAFTASSYPTLATSTDGKSAAVAKDSVFSLTDDNSALKHTWTLTKFLLTDDGKIRGTMNVTGSTLYSLSTIGSGTPDPTPTEPGDNEEDTNIDDPGAGSPTVDAFISTLMTKTGATQGAVLQWLVDTVPWYDPSVTTGIQAGLSTTFKTALQSWYGGTANAKVDDFLTKNGLTNIVAPLS